MIAQIEENRAKVVEAEAEVPKAIAEAFRDGTLGIMDYYKLRNVQSDTDMRSAISKLGVTPTAKRGNADMNAPLIAAGADAFIIVKLLALIFILGVPALGRLLASMQSAQPKLQPPPPRPDAKVSDEIEAFLHRISANRGPAGNVAAAARKPETPLRAELVVEDQDEPVGDTGRQTGGKVPRHRRV